MTTDTILTEAQAIREFFAIAGDEGYDDADVAEAVRELGNPAAQLPITRTTETVNDYRANGWTDHSAENGVTTLKKGKRTFVNIADCGDYRLVYVER